ncbi:hypothetical protein POM88_002972 [Heracleum sosnowskyi]|uniref:Uncharacterized protein n=1 Tax=Heracleum sosnowskyi TaxID=360622 RepID=A0AAD8NBV1_9APIA|nr:hypothetical protein POM88_002972 [Heracleum sosnowskyi]
MNNSLLLIKITRTFLRQKVTLATSSPISTQGKEHRKNRGIKNEYMQVSKMHQHLMKLSKSCHVLDQKYAHVCPKINGNPSSVGALRNMASGSHGTSGTDGTDDTTVTQKSARRGIVNMLRTTRYGSYAGIHCASLREKRWFVELLVG